MKFEIVREIIKGVWEWSDPNTLVKISGCANFYINNEPVPPQEFAQNFLNFTTGDSFEYKTN